MRRSAVLAAQTLDWQRECTLAGGDALIGLRSRGASLRPFDLVENMQRTAEARFRQTEQELSKHLDETQKKLTELRTHADKTTAHADSLQAHSDRTQAHADKLQAQLDRVQALAPVLGGFDVLDRGAQRSLHLEPAGHLFAQRLVEPSAPGRT